MAGFIPETIIDQIQAKCDIVDIISGYIPLKKAGRNYKTTCPFHHEKTPSFMVSSQKQIFHCFGCGAGGNVFTFLMKHERIEFPEAVRMLAKKYGIEVPNLSQEYKASPYANELLKINELAAFFYHETLVKFEHANHARNYLKSRMLKDETVSLFKLGFAGDSADGFIRYAKKFGISELSLERAGLILASEREPGYYDRFRNRVIFPIFNNRGKVIGFGGRTLLDETSPKYLNSPETELFNKGRNLYGLNFATPHIKEENFSIIVEGYLDLLTPFQSGVRNIVASLGTALTREHIRLLKRFSENIIMIYDSDTAGEIAALKNLDLLIEEGLNVRIVDLPKGYDPDSFVRKEGIEKFKNKIKDAKSLFEYKFKILSSKFDKNEVEGRAKIVSGMLPSLKRIKNAVLKSEYIKRLAEELNVAEESVIAEIKKLKPEKSANESSKTEEEGSFKSFLPQIRPAEKILVGLMLENIELAKRVKDKLNIEDFKDPNTKKVAQAVFEGIKNCKEIGPNNLIGCLGDEVIGQIVSEACAICDDLQDKEKCLSDCIKRIIEDNFKLRLNQLQKDIRLAQASKDDDKLMELVAEYNKLMKNSHEKI